MSATTPRDPSSWPPGHQLPEMGLALLQGVAAAAARQEADELRGEIARLTEQLARAEERLAAEGLRCLDWAGRILLRWTRGAR